MSYPKIGTVISHKKNTCATCSVCKALGTKKVHIQINWFRGEDVVKWACDRHAYNTYVERLLYS